MASLSSLLTALTDSLTSATASLPDTTTLAPPTEGISLLDLKTELLLSYLHNLTFLILLKLRNQTSNTTANNAPDEPSPDALTSAVTHKLIEHRIYLEKGVRPLESRLKYQLDKLLLAASEDAAATTTTTTPPIQHSTSKPPPLPPLTHRPNPSAFARPSPPPNRSTPPPFGPYRPPRIHPTTLPAPSSRPSKPRQSRTLETFIAEEMTSAPLAEPSIGAGSFLKGKEREREEERRAYEEMRLVRLPEEKGGKKRRRRDGGGGEDLLGGLGLRDGVFGDLKGGGKKRRKGEGGGERVGERWERRVERGVGRKRR